MKIVIDIRDNNISEQIATLWEVNDLNDVVLNIFKQHDLIPESVDNIKDAIRSISNNEGHDETVNEDLTAS